MVKKRTLSEVKEITNKRFDRVTSAQKTKTVYGTGKNKHMKAGVAYQVSYADADLLFANGSATADAPKAEKGK